MGIGKIGSPYMAARRKWWLMFVRLVRLLEVSVIICFRCYREVEVEGGGGGEGENVDGEKGRGDNEGGGFRW